LLPATDDRAKKPPKGEPYSGPPNVKETLEQFTDFFLSTPGKSLHQSVDDLKLIPVITRGIYVYFEKYSISCISVGLLSKNPYRTLGTNLLYVEERGQYAFLDNKYRSGINVGPPFSDEDQSVCSWYGADHLLRLLGTYRESYNHPQSDQSSSYAAGDADPLVCGRVFGRSRGHLSQKFSRVSTFEY
jgi:hypothetical protein